MGKLWEYFKGEVTEEERARIRESDLYKRGDTVLVWINEGDLWKLAFDNWRQKRD